MGKLLQIGAVVLAFGGVDDDYPTPILADIDLPERFVISHSRPVAK
jgi:hypothetical protein